MSQELPLNSLFENEDKNEFFESLCRDFSEENDYYRRTKILHSLVQTYLEYYKEELETNVKTTEFFEILSQIPFLSSKFLQTSTPDNFPVIESEPSNSLLNKSENLESVSLCFDDVLECLKAFCVTKPCVILVKISLNILYQGYTHCKDSEVIYGDLLEQFADQLGSFFKKIESLQMVVLQQLDELDVTEYLESDPHIDCIILEMGNLCQVVFSLDADIVLELWAKYLRIITNCASLKQISNIDSLSTHLASKNIEILQFILRDQDIQSEEAEEVAAKSAFYLEALSNLMNLFHDCFKKSISEFKTFLLSLLECLVSCYSLFLLDKTYLHIIRNSLLKNTFTVLSCLCADKEFLKSTLTLSDKQTHISNLLLKLCALQFMESASLEFKTDFFKSILSTCLSGSTEDDLKFLHTTVPKCTLAKVDSQQSVTLYQFAYEQITEFSKLLPDSVIEELETTVFDCLVSSSDVMHLLISDIWMFRLRCCSIEFFKDRCYSILHYLSKKCVENNNIECFTKRMLRFLPLPHKDRLLKEFINVKYIRDDKNIKHNYGIPYCTSTDDEVFICSEDQIKTRMDKLNDCKDDSVQIIKKACLCLELCTLFLNVADCSETLQFLEFAAELFKSGVYEIQIAVLSFIKALGKKFLPEHNQEFGNIVTSLAQLFSEAIHSKNYIVRYEARNVFNHFAKCTPHVKIIQVTVRRDPTLKPIMKSYMNALPDSSFLSEKEKAEYLKRQMLEMNNNAKLEIPKNMIELIQQFFSKGDFKLLT